MKKLIIVADWASDSLTNQEVKTAIEGALSTSDNANISFISSFPSTINTSFIVNQIVSIEERFGKPKETILFENTDPRIQTKNSVKESEGADFVVIKLKSGMFLCGPNAGYDFTMIKPKIDKIYKYKDFDRGSQFRSRDLYSKACAKLMEGKVDELPLQEEKISIIPDLDASCIGHIDNYGNIKTTLKLSDFDTKFKFGDIIEIEINGIKKRVKFVDNLFGGVPGELVVYPGSSGDPDNPYIEVTIWRHFTEADRSTGREAFNNPHPGERILILSS